MRNDTHRLSGIVIENMTEDQKNRIEDAVRSAGQIILDAHLEKNEVHQKTGPANFVTDYDVRIQEFLIDTLSSILPDCSFFGEEETEGNEHNVGSGYCFFIDPIDGTTNFMFDYKTSCVSVGLSLDGKLIAGWVFNPYTDQFWSAERGAGAYLNGKKISVIDGGLEDGICAFGCARYNEGDGIFNILPELFNRSLSIRNGGSAAIDLCRIASGSNVAYIEMLLQPYDYAAASVIIEEVGGVILQADGTPITINHGCSIVAGTKKAVEEVLNLVKGLVV